MKLDYFNTYVQSFKKRKRKPPYCLNNSKIQSNNRRNRSKGDTPHTITNIHYQSHSSHNNKYT